MLIAKSTGVRVVKLALLMMAATATIAAEPVSFTSFDIPGAMSYFVAGINDEGIVAGSWTRQLAQREFCAKRVGLGQPEVSGQPRPIPASIPRKCFSAGEGFGARFTPYRVRLGKPESMEVTDDKT